LDERHDIDHGQGLLVVQTVILEFKRLLRLVVVLENIDRSGLKLVAKSLVDRLGRLLGDASSTGIEVGNTILDLINEVAWGHFCEALVEAQHGHFHLVEGVVLLGHLEGAFLLNQGL